MSDHFAVSRRVYPLIDGEPALFSERTDELPTMGVREIFTLSRGKDVDHDSDPSMVMEYVDFDPDLGPVLYAYDVEILDSSLMTLSSWYRIVRLCES